MSWIALDDEIGAILHAITHPEISGPLNATAPTPVTNAEFTATLGRVLKRPTKLPTPVPALKLVYGSELVQHLLLEGQRVHAGAARGDRLLLRPPGPRLRAPAHPEPACGRLTTGCR